MTSRSSFNASLQAATKRLEMLARVEAFTTNEGKIFSAILLSAKHLADVLGDDLHFSKVAQDGFQRASLGTVEPERSYKAFLLLCALLLEQFLSRVRNGHPPLVPYLDVPEDRFIADLSKVLSLPEAETQVATVLSTAARHNKDPRDQWAALILEASRLLSDEPLDYASLQRDPNVYMPLTMLILNSVKSAVNIFDSMVFKLSITPANASQFAGNRPGGCGSVALYFVALLSASVIAFLLLVTLSH
jgi:hypothetical protein